MAAGTQYDTGLYQYRARGASDPNPGYGIYLRTIDLREFSDTPGFQFNSLVQRVGGGNSMSYQSYLTPGYGNRCYGYYAEVIYDTAAGNGFLASSYSDSRCRV